MNLHSWNIILSYFQMLYVICNKLQKFIISTNIWGNINLYHSPAGNTCFDIDRSQYFQWKKLRTDMTLRVCMWMVHNLCSPFSYTTYVLCSVVPFLKFFYPSCFAEMEWHKQQVLHVTRGAKWEKWSWFAFKLTREKLQDTFGMNTWNTGVIFIEASFVNPGA